MVSVNSWVVQNRFFFLAGGLVTILSGVLIVILLPRTISAMSSWLDLFISSEPVNETELEQRVALLETENQRLQHSVDSLRNLSKGQDTDEGFISHIRSAADSAGLILPGYDIQNEQDESGFRRKRFHLTARGRYHQFGEFLTRLGNSSLDFTIEIMSLQARRFGSIQLDGRMVVYTRLRDNP